jgi:hypothetical protein
VTALRKTWLKRWENVVILGDTAYPYLGIEAVKADLYCSLDNKEIQQKVFNDKWEVWGSRGRCTQLRFFYLFTLVRERFPESKYYLIVDDDIWMDARGVQRYLEGRNANKSWLSGWGNHLSNYQGFMWGGVLAFSSAAVRRLDNKELAMRISEWEFACSVHNCCDFNINPCHPNVHKKHFRECNKKLVKQCGYRGIGLQFRQCTLALSKKDDDGCRFESTRPDRDGPMWYVKSAWDGRVSHHASEHGDDHWFSWAVKSHGGSLHKEQRFWWNHHPFNKEICVKGYPLLSQHKLGTDEVYQWERKWKEKAPTKEACSSDDLKARSTPSTAMGKRRNGGAAKQGLAHQVLTHGGKKEQQAAYLEAMRSGNSHTRDVTHRPTGKRR